VKKRNERKWYEDGQYVVVDKVVQGQPNVPTLAYVTGMSGDYGGEVIYSVVEFCQRVGYPASERQMRPATKDEVAAGAAKANKRTETTP
jgi:hypothetical protein